MKIEFITLLIAFSLNQLGTAAVTFFLYDDWFLNFHFNSSSSVSVSAQMEPPSLLMMLQEQALALSNWSNTALRRLFPLFLRVMMIMLQLDYPLWSGFWSVL